MIFPVEMQKERLKWCFASTKNGAWGNEPDGDHDVVCLRAADFDGVSGHLNDGTRTIRAVDRTTYAKVSLQAGDLVIEKSGGGDKQLVGRAVPFDGADPSVCSNFLARARPSAKADSAYLNYLLLAIYNARGTWPHIKQSTGIQNLDLASYLNTRVSIPPLEIQRRIARVLDNKTARIDALIEKKRALLDRLAEKRQALITHAVTKGLDPDASMKDSGIEWLGEIPAHWQVKPLRRVLLGIEQGWSPAAEDREAAPDEWGVLKSGCVNNGQFVPTHKTLPPDISPITHLEVKHGDVLMCRASGSLHYIGSVAMVDKVRERLLFSDKTYRVHVDAPQLDKAFFVYTMAAKHLRDQIVLSVSGAEGLANNIAQASVRAYVACFPPVNEQRKIASYLDEQLDMLRTVRGKTMRSIDKLTEYRSALITAAVTGQLDQEAA